MSVKRFFSMNAKALQAFGSTVTSTASGFKPMPMTVSNVADTLAKARSSKPRSDWTKDEISKIYNAPLMDLIFNAQLKHREYQNLLKSNYVLLLTLSRVDVPKTVLTVLNHRNMILEFKLKT